MVTAIQTVEGPSKQEYQFRIVNITFERLLPTFLLKDEARLDLALNCLIVLGIPYQTGERPVAAWTRYHCELNNIPYQFPLPQDFMSAMLRDTGVMRFLTLLN